MKSHSPPRTVQDIRTMSERISDTDNPQRKYLALAMLELEKARRNKEKLSASQRVANIDQRLTDITSEQTGAAGRGRGRTGDIAAPASQAPAEPRAGLAVPGAGFTARLLNAAWRSTVYGMNGQKWKQCSNADHAPPAQHRRGAGRRPASFSPARCRDVQRVDIIKIAPISRAKWPGKRKPTSGNPTPRSSSLGLETGRPVLDHQPLPAPARRPVERAGIRTGRIAVSKSRLAMTAHLYGRRKREHHRRR